MTANDNARIFRAIVRYDFPQRDFLGFRPSIGWRHRFVVLDPANIANPDVAGIMPARMSAALIIPQGANYRPVKLNDVMIACLPKTVHSHLYNGGGFYVAATRGCRTVNGQKLNAHGFFQLATMRAMSAADAPPI
jgi:hypothetical protein